MQTNEDLIKRIAESVALRLIRIYANGGGGSFTMPLAADGVRGGVQLGYATDATARKYAVQLDGEKAYVNVPWTDHYAWSDITDKPTTATRWPSWSEVTSKPTSKTAWGQTYLNASSEFQNISGDMNSVGNISFSASGKSIGGFVYFNTTNGYLGIGDANPAYRLEVSGNCRISSKLLVATTDSTYALNVGGKIYCTGGFGFLSDIRMKNVIDRHVQLTVDQIADAPLIYYTLKGDADKRVQLGSVAQYWKTVLPETVQTDEAGTLSMQYDVQAHTAVVVLARKVRALWEEVEKIKKQANG